MENIVERANQQAGFLDSFLTICSENICCKNCGISEMKDPSEYHCLKFNKSIGVIEAGQKTHCFYFIPIINDDDERLTPLQHLILKEDEVCRPKINL